MASYSIKELEKLSGIKAHTIRIWEKRYKIIVPSRTQTNIRFYSDEDLRKILNISILNQSGIKISKIANLDGNELSDKVLDLCLDINNTNAQIENLIVAMFELDEAKFYNIFSNAIIKSGFEEAIERIIFPFLKRIGVLWQTGTVAPAQEHFVSNLIRQKLIVAIDNIVLPTDLNRKTIAFFLPEKEMHELGLLFYSFIARKEGYEVLYLGASVPVSDIETISKVKPNTIFFTSLVSNLKKRDILEWFGNISSRYSDKSFLISGITARESRYPLPTNFRPVKSVSDFKTILTEIKNR